MQNTLQRLEPNHFLSTRDDDILKVYDNSDNGLTPIHIHYKYVAKIKENVLYGKKKDQIATFFIDSVGQTKSNIALHKPAFQQNTYTKQPGEPDAGRFDARNAVDGLKSNLSALGGQCTISANNKTTAIWWVNLTRFSNVHYITIYYRTDNLKWGM